MTTLPTTDAMVCAAQDAYDVACADAAVAWARWTEVTADRDCSGDVEEFWGAYARWRVARAAREYAWAVLVAVREDRGAVPA